MKTLKTLARISYQLNIFENGGVGKYDKGGETNFNTEMQYTGTIKITHYDYENRIVSGTFELDVNINIEIYHLTDGRFDMNFTL